MICAEPAAPAKPPNILLILMDNLGYGEIGAYGGGELRGAPTPRLDALAAEGFRLTNFNVEAQCTPSRSSLMTGRYPIRSGTGAVTMSNALYGLTRWEETIPKMLAARGYVSGIFGKWHLGATPGRFPTDMGFDEWTGIADTSDSAFWPDDPMTRNFPKRPVRYVLRSVKGQAPEDVVVYDLKERARIDGDLTNLAIDFMGRETAAGKPFFAYVPYTMVHFPMIVAPDFDGKSGNGLWGDTLMQIDAYVGRLLDALDALKVADDTIVIFTSDNGPEWAEPWRGSAGPWRGSYFTGLEGSLRVPFLMRWPGHVPAGRASNEIVHEMDLFPTFARIAGGEVPKDRPIDGVDQTDFLTGQKPTSNRSGFVIYVGDDIFGVKWRNWKMAFKEVELGADPVKTFAIPHIYNLLLDPHEERPLTDMWAHTWTFGPLVGLLDAHRRSLASCPPIPPGQPDPYIPPPGCKP